MGKKQILVKVLSMALVLGLFFLGCNNSTAGSGESDKIIISGTLTNGGAPSPSIKMARSVLPASTQTFYAEVNKDNSITGKLKNGSDVFELTGNYNRADKGFSMQAPSSNIVFSIVGKLDADNNIDTDQTTASINIKEEGEWKTIECSIIPGPQTVNDEVNVDTIDVTSIPVYCQGIYSDHILGLAEFSSRFITTKNSITFFEGNMPPQDFTVVEVTNADGTPADEEGPWHFILRAKYYPDGFSPIDYTAKFYVSKTFSGKMLTDIGGKPLSDLFFGNDIGAYGSYPLSVVFNTFSGIRAFSAPYVSNDPAKVSTDGIYPANGYSPMFTGASATVNAKAATTLGAISGFTMAFE